MLSKWTARTGLPTTQILEEFKTVTITRESAIAYLADHGFTPTCSAYDFEENAYDGTSFDEQVGLADSYELSAVRIWLGY